MPTVASQIPPLRLREKEGTLRHLREKKDLLKVRADTVTLLRASGVSSNSRPLLLITRSLVSLFCSFLGLFCSFLGQKSPFS